MLVGWEAAVRGWEAGMVAEEMVVAGLEAAKEAAAQEAVREAVREAVQAEEVRAVEQAVVLEERAARVAEMAGVVKEAVTVAVMVAATAEVMGAGSAAGAMAAVATAPQMRVLPSSSAPAPTARRISFPSAAGLPLGRPLWSRRCCRSLCRQSQRSA